MKAASPGVEAENAARFEFTPWNVEIDEEQIMILTQADTHFPEVTRKGGPHQQYSVELSMLRSFRRRVFQ